MLISSTSAMQYQAIQQPSRQRDTTQDTLGGMSHGAGEDVAQISESGQQLAQVERDIASQYDVTNMTHTQMTEMAQTLKDNGLISGREQMLMTFKLPSSTDLSQRLGTNEKSNYLADFQKRFEFAKHGNSDKVSVDVLQQITSMLQHLDNTRK